jgi:hypothetical protein
LRALGAMLEPDPDKRPTRVTTQSPTTRAERQAASERDERRRRRAERESEPTSSSEWQRPEPWDLYALREQGREARRHLRDEGRRFRREIKEQVREETRRARRHARELRRESELRWQGPRHGFGPAAPLLISLVVLALSLARLATWALFRVFLPIFLTVLSVPLFSRQLRRAAFRCQEVGLAGDRGLLHAIEAVRGRMLAPDIEAEGEAIPEAEEEPSSERTPAARTSSAARVRVEPELERRDSESLEDDDVVSPRRQHR